jgi:hypothetical protein
MRTLNTLLAAAAIGVLGAACSDNDGTFEQAGEQIDEAAEETRDALNEATEDLDDEG